MTQWFMSMLGSLVSMGQLIPASFHVSSYYVVSNCNGMTCLKWKTFSMTIIELKPLALASSSIVFLSAIAKFWYANANAKLLSAFRTFEDQWLTLLILSFIERDKIITFGTSYVSYFLVYWFSVFTCMIQASANSFSHKPLSALYASLSVIIFAIDNFGTLLSAKPKPCHSLSYEGHLHIMMHSSSLHRLASTIL